MDLQKDTIFAYIRNTDISGQSIEQMSLLFCGYSNKEQLIAECFFIELQRSDLKGQKVILYLMDRIIKLTRSQSNAFINAFGSIILKTTEYIVKNSDAAIIDLLQKIIEQWKSSYIFPENLFKRCTAILQKHYKEQEEKYKSQKQREIQQQEERKRKLEQYKIIRQNKETYQIFEMRLQKQKLTQQQQNLRTQLQQLNKIQDEDQRAKQKQNLIQQMEILKEKMEELFLDMNKQLVQLNIEEQLIKF